MERLTCAELVELVSGYLDGELDRGTHTQVAEHLAGCPGCARYLLQLRETIHLLGRIRSPDLSR
jgi:anti-sigma factor RsiW